MYSINLRYNFGLGNLLGSGIVQFYVNGVQVTEAKKGDTVLFLGKGNEKTIERADGPHDYYELDEIRKSLKAIKKK